MNFIPTGKPLRDLPPYRTCHHPAPKHPQSRARRRSARWSKVRSSSSKALSNADEILQYTSPARYAYSEAVYLYHEFNRNIQVAIVLQGRHAGKKVVIIKQVDEGNNERKYPHAIVAGIERYPRKVTRRMGQKKLATRSKVKPFIKVLRFTGVFGPSLTLTRPLIDHQLLSPFPYTLRSGVGRSQGCRRF